MEKLPESTEIIRARLADNQEALAILESGVPLGALYENRAEIKMANLRMQIEKDRWELHNRDASGGSVR